MSYSKLALLLVAIALPALFIAGCGGEGNPTATGPPTPTPTASPTATATGPSTPTPSPTPTAANTPTPSTTQQSSLITTFSSEDCILQIPGDLGEASRVFRTDVDNEPKINIERVFMRFHQGESPSTILRCDIVTQGGGGNLFTTWWIQSLDSENAAFELFEGLIRTTGIAVGQYRDDESACANILPEYGEMAIRYTLKFTDRGVCTGAVFDGFSGMVWYRNNVIGIDSQFYRELFDLIAFHAQDLIDRKTQ